jgi:hypothetical protein
MLKYGAAHARVAKALTLRRNSGGVVERRITSWRNIDIFWQRTAR